MGRLRGPFAGHVAGGPDEEARTERPGVPLYHGSVRPYALSWKERVARRSERSERRRATRAAVRRGAATCPCNGLFCNEDRTAVRVRTHAPHGLRGLGGDLSGPAGSPGADGSSGVLSRAAVQGRRTPGVCRGLKGGDA
jgi:hypothetical protein